ncbi:histone-like DNA-binding protein [Candidatus Koribacter versatilis Ellin345]|uniref:Histone-like DNA-binding protein n=1 Tax=Koribacter versatilis (strain Ellin345) TaxID=204669 RepID=Q1IHE6_KORVE|nr:HU family DNA-binding protein [Candidatus Koribacter versatilis]ABF43704.1 histone-like DNA-binding protein [Candidatus Koribacter versatilis Ellin345]
MNKADLVDKIAAASGISKTSASEAIDALVDGVTTSLKKGERVTLVGFGTFAVSQRRARNGRNPQTGSVIKIAARKVAKFTPGVELKKAVNKSK